MDVLASAHSEKKMGRALADCLKHFNGNAQGNGSSGQGADLALSFSLHGSKRKVRASSSKNVTLREGEQ